MRDNPTMSRQKKLARVIASGKVKTAEEALTKVGYSSQTARHQTSRVIKSPVVQNELKRLGFTEENAKSAIGEVLNAPMPTIYATPDAKIAAAREVFRVTGAYAPEKRLSVTGSLSDLLNMVNKQQDDEQKEN